MRSHRVSLSLNSSLPPSTIRLVGQSWRRVLSTTPKPSLQAAQGEPADPPDHFSQFEQALAAAEVKSRRSAQQAWAVIGRSSSRARLAKDKAQVLTEIRQKSSTARISQLQQSAAAASLQELTCILPGFDSWAARVKPALLHELLSDTARVADKIIQLHGQLPYVDINALVRSRPSLLSEQEFPLIPAGISKLAIVFEEPDKYASIVQKFPNVLLLDAEELLGKLQQQLGLDITPNVVLQDPSLLMSVADNRGLSIW
ncbi:hypothetical protein WJX74_004056 [Apatococcus lobatus]|uniref:Uncharacterized protein n=2 Tax=Apatococcus TaxID=904362 RepID=A0AAW1SP78_9CHLO